MLESAGVYYLYGTRAESFGKGVNGFDVYTSLDLKEWSAPHECFRADKFGLNRGVCWAPEVHKYNGSFYMLATFTKENGLRGTYILKSQSPLGPFYPHSNGAVTPYEWECLDGTLYIDKNGLPYLVFCHEHTQITDGTVCRVRLSEDLKNAVGEPVCLFSGSSPYYIEKKPAGEHYITDGPFMHRTESGTLLLIWSTFINHTYAQCAARSDNGEIDGVFEHIEPIMADDGGHGMIFEFNNEKILTYHSPNKSGFERLVFKRITELADKIIISQ